MLTLLGLLAPALAADRALLIETSTQPAGSAWHGADLSDAVPMVRRALEARGISEIDTLSGEAATLHGIRVRLDALALAAAPGDLVIVYYTGPGARARDDDHDEPDGLDELLVPYGATEDPSTYLRDDELGRRLEAVAAKVGAAGQVLVVLDACHSGTGTRGEAAPDELMGRTLDAAAGSGTEAGSGWLRASEGMVVVSAARHDQPARWRDDAAGAAGVLTRAFVDAVVDADAQLSYRALQVQLAEAMGREGLDQAPQVEGAVDGVVFGGRGTQTPFFRVTGATGRELTVDGGLLAGLTVGSRVALARPGARDPSAGVIARGEVVAAALDSARVTVDADVDDPKLWALVEEWGPPPALPVTVDATAEREAALFLAALGERVAVATDAPWTLRVDRKLLRLVHTDGTVIDGPATKLAGDPAAWEPVVRRVEGLLRADALRSLGLSDPEYRVSLRALPLLPPEDGACHVDRVAAALQYDGAAEWTAGQGVAFEVFYRGRAPAYVTLVAFPPEGGAARLLPAEGASPSTAKVDDLTTFTVGTRECLSLDTPGTYVVKVYATQEPLNVEWLEAGTSRGAGPDAGALKGHTAAVTLTAR